LKRLSSASSTQSWAETYTYDGFGNLTQMTPTGTAPTLSVLVDAATNRMQGTGMGYDANGNLTNTAAWTLTYDVANRVSVASQELYAYAADNHRIYRRTPGGVDEIYVYGMAGEKLGTYTVTGTGTAKGSDVIFLSQKSTNVYFAGKMITAEGNQVAVDRLGSVRSGGPPNPGYQDQRYYPYGVEFPTTIPPGQPGAGQLQYSTPNDREKYATYARDSATGLDYAVNRYYASIWGRFLSPDPQDGGYTSEPQSLNLYGYVLGDPVNFNDPDGLDVHFPLKPGPLNCLNTRVMLYARASNSSQLDAFFNSAAGTWAMTLFLEEDHGSLSDRHTTWALMSDVFANRKYLDPGWASQAHINQGSW
jgi:RHS repeat-associated protein